MHDEDRDDFKRPVHVLLAGGGSGGHVYPALAIAAELVERGDSVSWVGRSSSMEERLVVAAELPFHHLGAKPWVGKGLVAKARAALTLATSAIKARALIRDLDVDAVLGTGGYVSTPALLGAKLARRPAFLFEPNAVAGAANRLASRWCRTAFVGTGEAGRLLACEAVVSGIPVRKSFYDTAPAAAGDLQLLVLGGSQGALQINQLMPEVVNRLRRDGASPLRVVHQTGRAHHDTVSKAYSDLGIDLQAADSPVRVVAFIDDMAAAVADAHLVVSRAGALATAELAAAGRPAILIPLTAAGAGHQRFNAERLEQAGAAVMLADADVTAAELSRVIASLAGDRERLETMAAAARAQATPTAAAEIAEALERAGGAN